ncbi:hypothetical protein RCO27_15585 [Sphingosinicella sp. LHD-64]|uniref:hypothetical protein n=1 Tax=Sphingosinicella sp. LHD-64 TaxID=3072139 RepID=UPI00280C734C|nr:hypothetical protein [Sphingosinicella sp. LHD-64]MDQ8757650.1 hypothetical protein [Sphingosinicella sp. LHD-64]
MKLLTIVLAGSAAFALGACNSQPSASTNSVENLAEATQNVAEATENAAKPVDNSADAAATGAPVGDKPAADAAPAEGVAADNAGGEKPTQ